jgi:gas vesicle structural protein
VFAGHTAGTSKSIDFVVLSNFRADELDATRPVSGAGRYRRCDQLDDRHPMALSRTPANASVIDVLDHVLDKGIVIDAWVRIAVAGIDLVNVEARIVVASMRTYSKHARALRETSTVSMPLQSATRLARYRDVEQQLRLVRDQLEHQAVLVGPNGRRAEDRILEELRETRTRIANRPASRRSPRARVH